MAAPAVTGWRQAQGRLRDRVAWVAGKWMIRFRVEHMKTQISFDKISHESEMKVKQSNLSIAEQTFSCGHRSLSSLTAVLGVGEGGSYRPGPGVGITRMNSRGPLGLENVVPFGVGFTTGSLKTITENKCIFRKNFSC